MSNNMTKRYILDNETFVYNDILNEATNIASQEKIPTIIFLNKIQSLVTRFDFNITVFGEGDDEYGKSYECKVRQGFNTIIYEAPVMSNRTNGILDCYEWLINNDKLNKIHKL